MLSGLAMDCLGGTSAGYVQDVRSMNITKKTYLSLLPIPPPPVPVPASGPLVVSVFVVMLKEIV
jgi:hypothetical protein